MTESADAAGTAKFTGQDRGNYETAEAICGANVPRKTARDLGLKDNQGRTSDELVAIATEYSQGYRANFQQAAFEGCLAGLPDASG